MTLAIMQPTFLPWSGYFNLMAEADRFVFLDDAQFEKQSWQSRNRILVQSAAHLAVAATLKAPLDTPIHAIRLAPARQWLDPLLGTIRQSYAASPCAAELIDMIAAAHAGAEGGLAAMNIAFITAVAERLGLTPEIHRSTALGIPGQRSRRLEAICRHFRETHYLSPVGSRDYLAEDGFGAGDPPITLTFQSFAPQPYRQRRATAFVSHLSIVDVVAQIGWAAAAQYVRTGAPPPE
jgi:hypothetical protein